MRILMVLDRFYPEIGGAEKQALLLSNHLSTVGVSIKVLTSGIRQQLNKEVYNRIEINRITIYGWYHFRQIWFMLYVAFKLFRLNHEYDLIHVHGAKQNAAIASVVGSLLGIPVIVKVTNSGERFDLKLLKNWMPIIGSILTRLLLKYTTRFIALTEPIRKELLHNGVKDQDVVIIPNGVTLITRQYHSDSTNSEKVGVCVASLTKKKNHGNLIKALKHIPDNFRYKIYLVGDGPCRYDIEKQLDELCLRDKVIISGLTDDMQYYYSMADFFILISWTEGLSNALLEAFSYGLPCIVSDIPGNRRIVQNGINGLLVDPSNQIEIAKSLTLLISNGKICDNLSEAANNTIQEFSITNTTNKYLRLYNNLIQFKNR